MIPMITNILYAKRSLKIKMEPLRRKRECPKKQERAIILYRSSQTLNSQTWKILSLPIVKKKNSSKSCLLFSCNRTSLILTERHLSEANNKAQLKIKTTYKQKVSLNPMAHLKHAILIHRTTNTWSASPKFMMGNKKNKWKKG